MIIYKIYNVSRIGQYSFRSNSTPLLPVEAKTKITEFQYIIIEFSDLFKVTN